MLDQYRNNMAASSIISAAATANAKTFNFRRETSTNVISVNRLGELMHGYKIRNMYPKILCAPEKEERKTENGDIAWRRSSLSRAWVAEIMT